VTSKGVYLHGVHCVRPILALLDEIDRGSRTMKITMKTMKITLKRRNPWR